MIYELVKREDRWDLYNSEGYKVASTLKGCKSVLSFKNCQEIEHGYNLDDLAIEECNNPDLSWENDYAREKFKAGFQKALELMGDKKFSEGDIHEAFMFGERGDRYGLHDILKSRQQNELEVEIIKEIIDYGLDESCNPQYSKAPKLDENGCLILKRV
jgi:hypothetical protein